MVWLAMSCMVLLLSSTNLGHLVMLRLISRLPRSAHGVALAINSAVLRTFIM
jgi:hypothetical protein